MAILLGKKSIVEALVEDEAEAADCECKQFLFSRVNHFHDALIGRDMGLKAMDIAALKNMGGIFDILDRKGLKAVRCRTM